MELSELQKSDVVRILEDFIEDAYGGGVVVDIDSGFRVANFRQLCLRVAEEILRVTARLV